jgi:hypothetical protein
MRSSVLVMHRCVPLRRQQAGRVDAASSNVPGAISEKPITANRKSVDTRCTVPWYILPLYLGNGKRVRDIFVYSLAATILGSRVLWGRLVAGLVACGRLSIGLPGCIQRTGRRVANLMPLAFCHLK